RNLTRHFFPLALAPLIVSLTSMLSPAAAKPEPLLFSQWSSFVEFTVHDRSSAFVVLSITATTTVLVPCIGKLVSAYRFVTVAPPAGIGPARMGESEKPLVGPGHG